MREKICSQEIAVARAVRTGLWDSALRDHAAACAACKELVVAVSAMRSLAAGFEQEVERPDAGWLWRKALLEKKQAEADRARRPLLAVEFASVSAMILASAGWMGWHWSEVQEHLQVQFILWQTEPWPRLWQALWSFGGGTPQPFLGPLLLVLLLAVAAFLVAHPLFADE